MAGPTPTPTPKPFDPLDPSTYPGAQQPTSVSTPAPAAAPPPVSAPLNQSDNAGAADASATPNESVDVTIFRDPSYWEQLYKAHAIDRAGLIAGLTGARGSKGVGLSAATAELLAKSADYAMAKGNGLSVGEIQQMLKRGILDDTKALALLNEYHNPESAQYLLDLAHATNEKELNESNINQLVRDKKLTPEQAVQRLTSLGYDPEDAKLLVSSMAAPPKSEGESTVAALVKNKTISAEEGEARLIAQGYSQRDAHDLLITGGAVPNGQTPVGTADYGGGKTQVTTVKGAEGIQPGSAAEIRPLARGVASAYGPGAQVEPVGPTPHRAVSVAGGQGPSGGGAAGGAGSMVDNFSKSYQAAIGDYFHAGAVNPLAAHWALQNQDVFFAKHLGNGGGDTHLLPTAEEINLMHQGMQYAPRQRNTDANAAPVAQEPM